MTCYKSDGCGVYENRSCNECPASKPEYTYRKYNPFLRSGKTYFQESYVWYKLCVYYHAQTEVYDRMLTSLRNPHDPTEAYITEGSVRRCSMLHAREIRELIYEVADRFCIPHGIRSIGLRGDYPGWSAQRWIDEYNRLVEAGEMDFINEFDEV